MASPTSPRVFNLYDILGVMVPGITLFTGFLLLLPDPPAPSELWEYLLYGIVAFSLGYVVQSLAAKAVGELETFEITMDDVRSLLDPSEIANSSTSQEPETNTPDDQPKEPGEADPGEDEVVDTGDEEIRDNSPEPDESSDRELDSTGIAGHVLYAFLGPILWWRWSPTVQSIGNSLHANRVWRDLRDTYNLEPGTDDYEQLQQMIQSEVDDVRSPSRAYRFQAIRNFHRGMWISLWIISVLLVGYLLNEWRFGFEIAIIHATEEGEPYIFQQDWWLTGLVVAVLSLVAFWRLHVEFQRKFVRYLIIDYFVKLRERGEVETESR